MVLLFCTVFKYKLLNEYIGYCSFQLMVCKVTAVLPEKDP